MGPKVVDFYCGAGGFSEGFSQLGFEIVAGFDIWREARLTFGKNHPSAYVPDDGVDIPKKWDSIASDLEKRFGKIDVVVGGPPCMEFSSAKKWGNGDFEKGLVNVDAFLKIVERLNPRYWVMENVPRITKYWDAAVESGKISPPGETGKWILESQFHSVPQARQRCFIGTFPGDIVKKMEDKRRKKLVPMKVAIDGLPSLYDKQESGPVTDPLYPGLEIPGESLTDHHGYGGFVDLTGFEIQMNEDLKHHHPFGGKMSFPDDLDRPSRTIMATQFSVSRMSIVIEDLRSRRGFRRPTPRECACFQGYPISYQFWGTSSATKYKLVGNSVPVGVSRNIARSILEDMGKPVTRNLLIKSKSGAPSTEIELPQKKKHVLRDRFRWHSVECMVAGSRVDLDNTGEFTPKKDPDAPSREFDNDCRWDSVLHVGIGRPRWKHAAVRLDPLVEALAKSGISQGRKRQLLADVRAFHGSVPDSKSLLCAHKHPSARSWRLSDSGVIRPRALLERVDVVSKRAAKGANDLTDCAKEIPISPEEGLPTITLVAAFVTYWLCQEINYCTSWMNENSQSKGRPRTHDACFGVLSDRFPESI